MSLYPNCELHSQPLSRVCVDDKCNEQTLLCCICEYESHNKHKTMSLKTLLGRIRPIQMHPLDLALTFDGLRNSYFQQLARQEQQVHFLFNDLRAKGALYFTSVQDSLHSLLQLHRLSHLPEDPAAVGAMKTHFRTLLSFLNLEQEGDICIKDNFDKAIALVQNKLTNIKDKVQKMQQYVEEVSKEAEVAFASTIESGIKSVKFQWSEELKGKKMKIKDNCIVQMGMEASGQRFAMMEPTLSQVVRSKWAIKIIKFVGWIGVGVCLKNQIKSGNFAFNYSALGHGSYMISSNGYVWSSVTAEMNSVQKAFQFGVSNEIVLIEYVPNDNKILFQKASNIEEKFQLFIPAPSLGDSYCPCVNLCNTGDQVSILPYELS